jgi:cation diffusion facilitator CzcD-associated flavoprotein CzcO
MEFIIKYLVIATGPTNHKVFPAWAECLDKDICQHSIGHGIFGNVAGKNLLLVGGGHATPDIACRMWELGANSYCCCSPTWT